jgi:glucose/arabinose dehydrogenase
MGGRSATTVATISLAVTAASLTANAAPAQRPPIGDGDGGFSLAPVGSFDTPIDAEAAPGFPRVLFVAEQRGRILAVKRGAARTFLDIGDQVQFGGEQGQLSLAFHPGYKRNRLLYVYFTNNQGDNVVMEFRRKSRRPLQAKLRSQRQVLYLSHPVNSNHNGGKLHFGPDRRLYLSTGDGGSGGDPPNNAQSRDVLLGKLLRIDPRRVVRCKRRTRRATRRARRTAARNGRRCGRRPRPYTSPRGNPFAGRTPGRPEIYSLGLRNPFRFSFDAATGAIAIGDVGQGCREEIDYRRRGRARGANFGWSRFEGTRLHNAGRSAPGAIFPIHEYDNANAGPCGLGTSFSGQAVIAGQVVRNPRLRSQYGRLLYGDFTSPQIRSLIPSEAGASDDQPTGVNLPSGGPYSFAEGAGRTLYAITGGGSVYRLQPTP